MVESLVQMTCSDFTNFLKCVFQPKWLDHCILTSFSIRIKKRDVLTETWVIHFSLEPLFVCHFYSCFCDHFLMLIEIDWTILLKLRVFCHNFQKICQIKVICWTTRLYCIIDQFQKNSWNQCRSFVPGPCRDSTKGLKASLWCY